jgi:hypothetical protein
MTRDILQVTSSALGVSRSELDTFSAFYNSDYSVYGNEVYDDIKVRLVHLENFLQNNWWNNRFYYLWREWQKYDEIIDIGFSVPYLPLYVRQYSDTATLPKLLYVDGNETSKKVSEIILSEINGSAQYVVGSALEASTWKEIHKNTGKGRKLFTAFETIEHFEDSAPFWKELHEYKGNDLILSLPIGPKIPSHHLVFTEVEHVFDYLKKYIEIKEYTVFDGLQNDSSYRIFTCIGEIR